MLERTTVAVTALLVAVSHPCTAQEVDSTEAASRGDTSPFAKHLSEEGITLIDFSALRARFSDWDFLTERARSFVIAADAYMAVAGVTPSTTFDRFREGDTGSGDAR